jgi:hypothetical protein
MANATMVNMPTLVSRLIFILKVYFSAAKLTNYF